MTLLNIFQYFLLPLVEAPFEHVVTLLKVQFKNYTLYYLRVFFNQCIDSHVIKAPSRIFLSCINAVCTSPTKPPITLQILHAKILAITLQTQPTMLIGLNSFISLASSNFGIKVTQVILKHLSRHPEEKKIHHHTCEIRSTISHNFMMKFMLKPSDPEPLKGQTPLQ